MKKIFIILFMLIISSGIMIGETLDEMLQQYKEHPENFQLCNKIGIEYINQNNINAAKNYFLKSIILNNNYYRGYYNLGVIYYKQGDFKRAVVNFKRAYSINKRDENVALALLNTLLKLKKYSEVKAVVSEFIRYFANNVRILNSIGIYYILMNDFNKAYKYFSEALKINKNYRILNNIAITKYFLKDKPGAIKYLRSISKNYKIIDSNLSILGGKNK